MKPRRFKVGWTAIRPKTLWASISPVLIGTAISFRHLGESNRAFPRIQEEIDRYPLQTIGERGDIFHWGLSLLALIGALLLQVGANLVNDYEDHLRGADRSGRVGPTRVTQAGWVRPEAMRTAATWIFIFALIIGLLLSLSGGIPILLIALASILSAYLYTGGPYPLGYHGWGEIFAFFFFGPVAVLGVCHLHATANGIASSPFVFSPLPILISLTPGFFAAALLMVNNLRDVEGDRQIGKNTLTVRWGKKVTRWEYLFCVGAAMGIPLYGIAAWGAPPTAALCLIAAVPLYFAVRGMFREESQDLNRALHQTGLAMFIFSLFLSLGWIFPTLTG